jgi:hypothetical protein
MTMANTLAYYDTEIISTGKWFIVGSGLPVVLGFKPLNLYCELASLSEAV